MGHAGVLNVDLQLRLNNGRAVPILRWGILGAGNISHDFALALRSTRLPDPNARKYSVTTESDVTDAWRQPALGRRQSHQYEKFPTIHQVANGSFSLHDSLFPCIDVCMPV